MALEPCRECGTEVSTEAETCPNCGTPNPTAKPQDKADKKKRVGIGCLVLAGLLVLMVILVPAGDGSGDGNGDTEEPSSDYVDLDGAVRFTGTQFILTNSDSFAWTDCTLDVNGGVIRSGYTLHAPRIEPGETYAVGAMQFAKSGGERFNPTTMRPNRFGAECQTPEGVGFYTGEW